MEDDYVDQDFIDSYTRFYYLSHRTVSKYTKRLHFFSSPLSRDGFFDIDDNQIKSYIGFMVCRPTYVNRVGTTVLCLPEKSGEEYVTCASSYKVHLFGFLLEAKGPIFLQQDAQVSCCASASVYMATRYMSERFGTNYRSTREISDLAARLDPFQGRGIPSRGLSTKQIAEVLTAMGYDPVVYGSKLGTKAVRNAIYRIIESEIPVILTFEYINRRSAHAVVVIGHSFDKNRSMETEYNAEKDNTGKEQKDTGYFSTSDLVDYFIISDDRRGPCRKMQITDPDKGGDAILKIQDENNEVVDVRLQSIIVPFPRGVWLDADKAERKAHTLLKTLKANGKQIPDRIVLRTYLRSSIDFKHDSIKFSRGKEPFEYELGAKLRGIRFPKYLWITEITTQKEAKEKRKIGEIVLDPSSGPFEQDFLAMHINGQWIIQESEQFVDSPIKGFEGAYPMFTRAKLYDR